MPPSRTSGRATVSARSLWEWLNRPLVAQRPRVTGLAVLPGPERGALTPPTVTREALPLVNTAGDVMTSLTSPLNIASLVLAGGLPSAAVVRAGMLPRALGPALATTARAVDVAQSVPALLQGGQLLAEGVREGRPEAALGGTALAVLGGAGLRGATSRLARLQAADEALARPVRTVVRDRRLTPGLTPASWDPRPVTRLEPDPTHPLAQMGNPDRPAVDYAVLTGDAPREAVSPEFASWISPDVALQSRGVPREDLLRYLRARGYKPTSVEGYWPPNVEESVLIPGIPEEEAITLGQKLGQEAILTPAGLVMSATREARRPVNFSITPGARSAYTTRLEATGEALPVLDVKTGRTGTLGVLGPRGPVGARQRGPATSESVRPTDMSYDFGFDQPNVPELGSGMIPVQHLTTNPLIGGVLRPRVMLPKAREGVPGLQRTRADRFGQYYQPQSYVSAKGAQTESVVLKELAKAGRAPFVYESAVPASRIYDAAADPKKLLPRAIRQAEAYAKKYPLTQAAFKDLVQTRFDRLIKRKNYLGVVRGPGPEIPWLSSDAGRQAIAAGLTGTDPLIGAAPDALDYITLFEPLPMRKAGEPLPLLLQGRLPRTFGR